MIGLLAIVRISATDDKSKIAHRISKREIYNSKVRNSNKEYNESKPIVRKEIATCLALLFSSTTSMLSVSIFFWQDH